MEMQAPPTLDFESNPLSRKGMLPPRRKLLAFTLPDTEEQLTCANKRLLYHSLHIARESRWVAEWLFTHPTQPFHEHTSIPADAFDNALAIRASHTLLPSSPTHAPAAAGPVVPGHDLLLVPVAHSSGRLIGYSFGGLDGVDAGSMSCGHDARRMAWFPHFVGRFAFDGVSDELVIVANRVNDVATGIMSVRRKEKRGRERCSFLVLNGAYGFRALPGNIAQVTQMAERRLASISKYQFAAGEPGGEEGGGSAGGTQRKKGVRTDMDTLRADLGKLERLVKGKFYAEQMIRDQMDPENGELIVRETGKLEATFDVKDAVGMQVFRDTAGRAYYSHMSAVASRRAAMRAGVGGK